MIQAVIPTVPGREDLLNQAVDSFRSHGVEPVVVHDSPSCGAGWAIGLPWATADLVLLASDDFEIADWSGIHRAIDRALSGFVVCPVILNPDGSLQGAGGMGFSLADGDTADNCIAPLGRRETLASLAPWPHLNHYCDTWITRQARERGIGPVVTHGVELTHHHLSGWDRAEWDEWTRWQAAA